MTYNIDERLSKVNKSFQEAPSGFGKIPNEQYLMQVVKVLIDESPKNKKLYLSLTLRVQGPTQKGYQTKKFYDLEDETKMHFLKRDLKKFNIDLPELQHLPVEAERMKGKYIIVDVSEGKGDFQNFNILKLYDEESGYSDFKKANEPAPF